MSNIGTRVRITKNPIFGIECFPSAMSDSEVSMVSEIERIDRMRPINDDIAVRTIGDPYKLLFRKVYGGVLKACIFYEPNRNQVIDDHPTYVNCLYDAITGSNMHLMIDEWSLRVIDDGSIYFCDGCNGVLTPSREGYLLEDWNSGERRYFSLRTGMFYCLPISLF